MRVIGITGGIGAGKSTVSNILVTEYNAYMIEADKLAHQLMEPDRPLYGRIVEAFGTGIVASDRTIDRNILGSIVFSDREQLELLNHLVHPAVKEYILSDIVNKRASCRVELYVIEAALLLEDGYREICDEIWYVHADDNVRLERLLASRGGTYDKWRGVMENQMSADDYKERCDRVIDNGLGTDHTSRAIKEILCLGL